MLRDKANFGILEGFLSELLQQDISIVEILDSESNKETHNDKYNRVDILVKDDKGELIIIEVQNSKEYDYFQRILYGTSKVITEHISEGQPYAAIKKVISITIAYFDLGQGMDYLYRGQQEFKGVHYSDTLNLSAEQKKLYNKYAVADLFPEYWLIKVDQFNAIIRSRMDEWIYFLKTGEIKEDFAAKGIQEAKRKLTTFELTPKERASYNYYLKCLRDIASEHHTRMADFENDLNRAERKGHIKGHKKGLEEGRKEGLRAGLKEGRQEGHKEGIDEVVTT